MLFCSLLTKHCEPGHLLSSEELGTFSDLLTSLLPVLTGDLGCDDLLHLRQILLLNVQIFAIAVTVFSFSIVNVLLSTVLIFLIKLRVSIKIFHLLLQLGNVVNGLSSFVFWFL